MLMSPSMLFMPLSERSEVLLHTLTCGGIVEYQIIDQGVTANSDHRLVVWYRVGQKHWNICDDGKQLHRHMDAESLGRTMWVKQRMMDKKRTEHSNKMESRSVTDMQRDGHIINIQRERVWKCLSKTNFWSSLQNNNYNRWVSKAAKAQKFPIHPNTDIKAEKRKQEKPCCMPCLSRKSHTNPLV